MFGYAINELEGRSTELLYADPADFAAQGKSRYRPDGGIASGVYEVTYRRKDGTLFPSETLGAKVETADGRLLGYLGVIRDITERKKAEKKLLQLNRELEERVAARTAELETLHEQMVRQERLAIIGRLAGSVAHDLRQPLGVISNSAYFLSQVVTEQSDARVRKHIGILSREVSRTDDIITDLVDMAGDAILDLRVDNINSLIREVLEELPLPEGVQADVDLDPGMPAFFFDPKRLQRVFCNLVTNAVQAMPTGGIFRIRSRREKGWAVLEFGDTGSGIAPDLLEKIFEPLFTTKARGVGLGLSIVRDFVEKHQGAIEVKSEVGKGTTFTVRLPIRPES
jgi:two-component system sensor kinase FixL